MTNDFHHLTMPLIIAIFKNTVSVTDLCTRSYPFKFYCYYMDMLNKLLTVCNPNYLEWYSPCLDLEHTIQVCRGEKG